MKAVWPYPTASGLCDRLCDFLYMYALARAHKWSLYTHWPEFEMKGCDLPHRALDIKMENVLKYIKMPEHLHFEGIESADVCLNFPVGGGLSAEGFYETYVNKQIAPHEFMTSVKEGAREFTFTDEILDYISTLPSNFIAFHIRRGDKVRDDFPADDPNGIRLPELDLLNSLTCQSIDKYIDLGHKNMFFCSDDSAQADLFAAYATSKGAKSFSGTVSPKWKSTYFDLAVLSKADEIIVSQRHSSFSRFGALIGNNSFKTVYNPDINGISENLYALTRGLPPHQ